MSRNLYYHWEKDIIKWIGLRKGPGYLDRPMWAEIYTATEKRISLIELEKGPGPTTNNLDIVHKELL